MASFAIRVNYPAHAQDNLIDEIMKIGVIGAGGGTGPTGPSGSSTNTGATGSTGPQGQQGPMGGQGMPGAAGPTGPVGGDGPTGPQGPAGSAANTGATGPVGPTGSAGTEGPTGPQGFSTNTGATGPTGNAGSPGPTGPAGMAANTGATGPQGPTGSGGAVFMTGPAGGSGFPALLDYSMNPPALKNSIMRVQDGNCLQFWKYNYVPAAGGPATINIPLTGPSGLATFLDINPSGGQITVNLPSAASAGAGAWVNIFKRYNGSPNSISSNKIVVNSDPAESIFGPIYTTDNVTGTVVNTTSLETYLQDPSQLRLLSDSSVWRIIDRGFGWVNVVPPPAFQRRVVFLAFRDLDWANIGNTVMQAVDSGFNVINLAFYIQTGTSPQPIPGPADAAYAWEQLGGPAQAAVVAYAHAAGAIVMVSAGGATDDQPYTIAPATYANNVCNWAVANNLDGVDFDLEHIQPGFTFPGFTAPQLLNWFNVMGTQARAVLGGGRVISHAPQSPYFSPPWATPTENYTEVYLNNPDIDFFNIQYYNQTAQYNSFNPIFVTGPTDFPGSAIAQIGAAGVPLSKLVLGCFLQTGDGALMPNDPVTIKSFVDQASALLGWNAGAMVWHWATTGTPTALEWVQTVFFTNIL